MVNAKQYSNDEAGVREFLNSETGFADRIARIYPDSFCDGVWGVDLIGAEAKPAVVVWLAGWAKDELGNEQEWNEFCVDSDCEVQL